MPARLAAGERLYHDVVYYYGPAGPWLEAAALRIFGRSLYVLEALGLVAAVVLLASLARLTTRAGSALSACLAAAWAAALCVGAPNGGSLLFPYSFDALFALAAGFVALSFAGGADRARDRILSAAGLAFALASKPEVGAAAAVVLFAGSLRDADREQARKMRRVVLVGLAAGAIAWTVALAGVPREGLFPEGPLALFSPPAEWRAVYRAISGLAGPAQSLSSAATALFLDAALLGAIAVFSRASRAAPRLAVILGIALVATGTLLLSGPWAGVVDRLPPLLAPAPALVAAGAIVLLRRPLDGARRARFLLFAFSAAVASRVVLGVLYGAVTTPYAILAAPGLAASAAVFVFDVVPPRLVRPHAFRRLAAILFVALAAFAVARWRRLLPPETAAAVSTPAGSFRLPRERAAALSATLEWLRTAARPGEAVAGFPETGLVNFATGLPNPLREEQILPGHLDPAGERRVVERLEDDARAPRFVLLANQPAPAFGAIAFGRDYAVAIWRAVERRYRLAASFGAAPPDAPVGDPRFFLRVYERVPAPP